MKSVSCLHPQALVEAHYGTTLRKYCPSLQAVGFWRKGTISYLSPIPRLYHSNGTKEITNKYSLNQLIQY